MRLQLPTHIKNAALRLAAKQNVSVSQAVFSLILQADKQAEGKDEINTIRHN